MIEVLEQELYNINVLSKNMEFIMDYISLKELKNLSLIKKIEYYIDSYNLVNDNNLLIENLKNDISQLKTLEKTKNDLMELQSMIILMLNKILEINDNLNVYSKHLLYSTLSKIDDVDNNYKINNLALIELYPQEIIDGYSNKEYLFYNDFENLNIIFDSHNTKLDFSKLNDKYEKENKSDILFIQESYNEYLNLKNKSDEQNIKTFDLN